MKIAGDPIRIDKVVDMLHRTANVCEKGKHKSRARILRALAKEIISLTPGDARDKIIARFKRIADQFEAGGHKKRAKMFRDLAEEFEGKRYL